MRLTKRMREIIDFCPVLTSWADVGCDHGRITCSLILEKKAERVFAADISAPSLAKAEELAKTIGIGELVELRLGDGLSPLIEDAVEGVVMTGMGGPLILDILKAQPEFADKLKYMVLSPQKYPERVRRYLNENAFVIEKECMVEEAGKYYPVMLVRKGEDDPYSETELLVGRRVRYDEDYEKYLRYKINFWMNVRSGVAEEDLAVEIEHKIEIYREIFKNKFDIDRIL